MCMNEVRFVCLFHMLMRKQMILTILIISVALRTIPELQVISIQLSPSADCAAMARLPCFGCRFVHCALKLLLAVYLFR